MKSMDEVLITAEQASSAAIGGPTHAKRTQSNHNRQPIQRKNPKHPTLATRKIRAPNRISTHGASKLGCEALTAYVQSLLTNLKLIRKKFNWKISGICGERIASSVCRRCGRPICTR